MKTAILVDGGFYRKVSQRKKGNMSPQKRACELEQYCYRHLKQNDDLQSDLYRIFYYDCQPMNKKIYHPLLRKTIDFAKTDMYKWANEYLDELTKKRKFALRLGKLSEEQATYTIKTEIVKKVCHHKINLEEIKESDFILSVTQKGVDMKIGLDIASLAYKKLVDQIVLISADSDFVPAAKLARREGIDFILDPLGCHIKDDLFEHIDGLRSKDLCYSTNHDN